MTTGKELELKRVAMDVLPGELADAMDVKPSQVSRWENSRNVTEKAATRYLTALATFGTIPTVEVTLAPEEAA